MKKAIVNFTFSRVRKSEFPEIMNAVLAIVEKHNPSELFIVGMYNLLLELKPLLDILTVRYDGYPVTKEFVTQRALRDKLLSAILSHITAIEKAGVASTAQQASLAVPYLKRYLKGITVANSTVKTGKVDQLLVSLEENTEIKTALAALGLTIYIDELSSCQQIINQGESRRREILSVRDKFNSKNAQVKIAYAFSNLLNAIELARVEHAHIDYMPLINELNVLLSSKQTMIKSRITRSKNGSPVKVVD